jgi:DNA adenine methylase
VIIDKTDTNMNRHKTPLRYPGGKQKLSPFLTEIVEKNNLVGGHYVEPYAGGAGVALELLISGKVSHVHLNDSCKRIYAFWRSVLNKSDELCALILRASLTVDEWRRQQAIFAAPEQSDELNLGFATFYLNRCNRSGILSGGLIGGLRQDGDWRMDARFSRNELIRRIEVIASKAKEISLRNWDAERFIKEYLPQVPEHSLIYLDPPYFKKADRLYLNHYSPDDHERIAAVIQQSLKHKWIVSYDNAPEISQYYLKRRSFEYDLQYNASKAYMGKELIIVSDDLVIPDSSNVLGVDAALQKVTPQFLLPKVGATDAALAVI